MDQFRFQRALAPKFLQTSALGVHEVTELQACKLPGPSAGAHRDLPHHPQVHLHSISRHGPREEMSMSS